MKINKNNFNDENASQSIDINEIEVVFETIDPK
jgi:hypothetical protein